MCSVKNICSILMVLVFENPSFLTMFYWFFSETNWLFKVLPEQEIMHNNFICYVSELCLSEFFDHTDQDEAFLCNKSCPNKSYEKFHILLENKVSNFFPPRLWHIVQGHVMINNEFGEICSKTWLLHFPFFQAELVFLLRNLLLFSLNPSFLLRLKT